MNFGLGGTELEYLGNFQVDGGLIITDEWERNC